MPLEGLPETKDTAKLYSESTRCVVEWQWTRFEIHLRIPLYLATIDDR